MSNGTVIVCGGNGPRAVPPTKSVTLKNRSRANIYVEVDAHDLAPVAKAVLEHFVSGAVRLIGDGIAHITGDSVSWDSELVGGNGGTADPAELTVTINAHTRANIAVAAFTHDLSRAKAFVLEHFVKGATYALAEGIQQITGDEYEQHVGDPPPNP